MTIGVANMQTCYVGTTEAAAIVVTMTMVTVPLELFNLLWFNVVLTDSEFSSKLELATSCEKRILWLRQFGGKLIGILGGCTFIMIGSIFAADPTPLCSSGKQLKMIGSIMLYEFIATPLYMSLPYWREQSWVASLFGQAGPVIGLLIYLMRKNSIKMGDYKIAGKEVEVNKVSGFEKQMD